MRTSIHNIKQKSITQCLEAKREQRKADQKMKSNHFLLLDYPEYNIVYWLLYIQGVSLRSAVINYGKSTNKINLKYSG